MHPRTEELLHYLDEQRAVLLAAAARVPPGLREARPRPDAWSATDVLDHLALLETSLASILGKRLAEAQAAGLDVERDTRSVVDPADVALAIGRERPLTAPESLGPRPGLQYDAALSGLDQAGDAFRAVVRRADGLAVGGITLRHPAFGPLNFYQWIVFVAAHETRHAAQIDEIREALTRAATLTDTTS
jgi:DinB family protein